MFKKRYLISVTLENIKDATFVAAMEGYGNVKVGVDDIYPVDLVIPKPRTYFRALRVSLNYSRMGIHNAIIKQS